ncbi:MAG: SpoIIE family protein phosphatase [Paludibacterium sp.]|uniref:PP2C family protein-serine/threonine phosphatase n=1 Tax=Paludibacterium sp. TaxID=1917523 RepID=UPI0025FA2B3F|nr:SpoIIE family protein phosphatase [Paludibacterium sp.]MBV8048845.1 SpoIIE family protein phosphatase [Paludibacterium sp.]MBV8646498.1 SpoIIE family protein phosphatase [Paludibacterium sp.]
MPASLILLVDDNEFTLDLQVHYLEQAGLTCHGVNSGQQAVDFCRQHRPDLIVMDMAMPEMDGMQTTVALRQLFGDDWVPILFLSAYDEEDQVLAGLASGGDDYLTKPVKPEFLLAKIRVFLRIASLQRQIAQDAVRLARYYEENEFEQTLALELIQRLTYRSFVGQAHIWHRLHPAGIFNGDIICRSDAALNTEHFLLADCTGHGLTAAISALPVIDGFYELVKQYLSTSLLASGINKKLHSLLPTGRFVAAALCSIDYDRHTLSVWNGGIPCALLIGPGGQLRHAFDPRCPPLGILDEDEFDSTLEVANWQEGDLLVLTSDGITEASTPQGEQFGLAGVLSAIKSSWPDAVGSSILNAVKQHLNGDDAKDDVSLLIIQLHRPAAG